MLYEIDATFSCNKLKMLPRDKCLFVNCVKNYIDIH